MISVEKFSYMYSPKDAVYQKLDIFHQNLLSALV